MPESHSISLGMPVEIENIERELKKLWDAGEQALTRASMVNFAIYCHGLPEMERNTELMAKLMQSHACRAILIGVDPGGGASQSEEQTRVHAWINAHCHVTREGAKQVCCEQISFLLEGDAAAFIPNIVFSHLDSDLPLYLWWQGDFTELCQSAADCQVGSERQPGLACQVSQDFQSGFPPRRGQPGSDLWPWVDRLFFDSLEFTDPQKQFCYLRTCIMRQSGSDLRQSGSDLATPNGSDRLVLCDLNWGRSLCLRQAMAQIFESPQCLAQLKTLNKISLSYAPGFQTTAALLAGWMISVLNWNRVAAAQTSPEQTSFGIQEREDGKLIISFGLLTLEMCEEQGEAISNCSLYCQSESGTGKAPSFCLRREAKSAYWHADICLPEGCEHHHLFPAGCPDTLSLLDDELMLGGKHLVYLKSLAVADSFL